MKRLIVFSIVLLMSAYTFGQKATLENVRRTNLKSSGTIISGNDIKGYYFFYFVDKVDKKSNEYLLQILDENLNKIGSKSITASNKFLLLEASYNGNNILMRFIDGVSYEVKYLRFDNKGGSNMTSSKKFDKKDDFYDFLKLNEWTSFMETEGEEISGNKIFAIQGKGFVDFVNNGDVGNFKMSTNYEVKYISDASTNVSWTYKAPAEDYNIVKPTYLASSNDMLYYSVMKMKKGKSNDWENWIVGLNLETGKPAFNIPLHNDKYSLHPSNALVDSKTGNLVLFGTYMNVGDSEKKGKSIGLYTQSIDKSGKLVKEVFNSYATEISKVIPMNQKGKIEDFGFLYIHEMIQTEDGKIFLIGEQFKKVASAMGIAATLLGSTSSSVVNVSIGDLAIIEFSPDFKINSFKIYEKTSSKLGLPAGAGMLNAQMLGKFVDIMGGFDYAFTQRLNNNKSFSVGYLNRDKEEGGKKKSIFGALNYNNGTFTEQKISLENEATSTSCSPAKPGYVMISEYYRKLKKIELRLEKYVD